MLIRVHALFILFLFTTMGDVRPASAADFNVVTGRICQSVTNRQPIGGEKLSSFDLKDDTVVLWTRVKSDDIENIRHVWHYDGRILANMDLKLVHPANRVYSKKKIMGLGDYRVEVLGPDKKLLNTYKFRIVDSPNGKRVEPGKGTVIVKAPMPASASEHAVEAQTPTPEVVAPPAPVAEVARAEPKAADFPVEKTPEPALPVPVESAPVIPPEAAEASKPAEPPLVPQVVESPKAPEPPPPPRSNEPTLFQIQSSSTDGMYAWSFRINGVAPGLSWNPYYRSGIYGVRLHAGVDGQKGKTAASYQVFWMWRLLPRLDFEAGGGTQNWNNQNNSMMSANLALDLEAGRIYGLSKVFIGYSKIDIPFDSLKVIMGGIEFNF